MRLTANAKINIGLRVGAKRDDGFHDIETIMARISLSDIIEAEVSLSDETGIKIKGNESYIDGKADLMEKAARLYSEISGWKFYLDINIEKHIPVKSGLGGGSSDAAAILGYLESISPRPLGKSRLFEISSAIGSDVPFFISGFSGAYVSGRGEWVQHDVVPSGAAVLLFFPEYAVSTAEAYGKLDSLHRENGHIKPLLGTFPSKDDYPNDFELVSPLKAADIIPAEIMDSGAYISLSGSGSCWYALFHPEAFSKFDNPEKYGIVSAYII